MTKKILVALVGCVGVLTASGTFAADETNAPPVELTGDAAKIVHLLKSRYVDRDQLNERMLDQASVSGILEALGQGAVVLSTASAAAEAEPSATSTNAFASTEPLARAEVIEPNIGYLRLADVNHDAVVAIDERLRTFADAKVGGYILDLRFARGTDYAAAAEIAGRFLNVGKDLFVIKSSDAQERVFRTDAQEGAPSAGEQLSDSPLLLLVNGQTRGSAEALAGGLRAQDRGILIGGITAGSAAAWEDVKLDKDRVLRVATAKVVLRATDPAQLVATNIFPNGLAPDIFVQSDLSVEHDVVLNASTNVTLSVSLQPEPIKKRLSEADLVKAFKGEAVETIGLAPSEEESPTESDEVETAQPQRDVVLQRAVDVMKGIRVLLSWQ